MTLAIRIKNFTASLNENYVLVLTANSVERDAVNAVLTRRRKADVGLELLVALAVPSEHAERAARAITTAIQPLCAGEQTAVDLATFVPGEQPPWLTALELEPFYSQAMAGPHSSLIDHRIPV